MPDTGTEDLLAQLSTMVADQAKANADAMDALKTHFSTV